MIPLARCISVIAHPFVMIALWVAATTLRLQDHAHVPRTVGLVAAIVIVPNVIFMVWQVRRGAWATVDASDRAERPMLYVVGLPTLAALIAYLLITDGPSFLVRGASVAFGLLTVCAITSRWLKVSLHLEAAALTGIALLLIGSPVGWIVVALIPALAWSRLALRRHTPLELAVGFLYGVLAAAAVKFL